MAAYLPLFLASSLFLLPGDDRETAKLQGAWVATGMIKDGTPAPDREWQAMRLTFQESKLLWKGNFPSDPDREQTMNYSLDAAKSPKQLDVQLPGGRKLLCIYEIKGEELKLCMKPRTTQRPDTFESTVGSDLVVLTLKRNR